MSTRARLSGETVWPSKPVRLFGALLTLGRSRRWRLEFTPEGVREVFAGDERWTPWPVVRAAYIGPDIRTGYEYFSWLELICVPGAARKRGNRGAVPIAVSRMVAHDLVAPQMARFAPDVRFSINAPAIGSSFYWPQSTMSDLKSSLRTVRVAFHCPWRFKVRGRANGAETVWCAEVEHASDPTLNESGPDRLDMREAIEDAIEMARRLIV